MSKQNSAKKAIKLRRCATLFDYRTIRPEKNDSWAIKTS